MQVLCQLAEYLLSQGKHFMVVSYKRLWKLLIDKGIKKKTCAQKPRQLCFCCKDGQEWSCNDRNFSEGLHCPELPV